MPPASEKTTRRSAGSLRQRADGSFEISVYNQALGKRVYETVRDTKSAAEKRLRQLVGQKDQGVLANPGKLTTGVWLSTWLTDYAPAKQQASSLVTTAGYVRKWAVPTLGRVPLSRLTADHLQQAVNAWSEAGLTPRSVHRCYAGVRSALHKAVQIRLLPHSPTQGVELPRIEPRDSRALTLAQTRLLLDTIQGTERPQTLGGDLYPLVLLAVTTALRKGELMALRWENVDLDEQTLTVTHALKRDQSRGTVKNKSSRRTLFLPGETVQALRHHKGAQAQRRLRGAGQAPVSGALFASPQGLPWSLCTVNRAFNPQVQDAGLPPMHFHDLRHSHASQLLEAGENIKVVSERLGHANATQTLNTYSHALPGAHQDLALRYDRLFKEANA